MVRTRPAVAIAACRHEAGGAAGDLYPDDDRPLLRQALESVGVEAVAVTWDDDTVTWADFDAVVVRSTWDSVDRPQEYLTWARAASGLTTLLNSHIAIEWSLDKTYLRELGRRGVPVVPTTWVNDGTPWSPPTGDVVVKPSISAGGRETARYRPGEVDAAQVHVRRLVDAGQTAMVQPYVDRVDTEGEAKLVFIDGRFSHAMRVGPLLVAGAGVLERPWERDVALEVMTPSAAASDVARRTLAAAGAATGCAPFAYARVDLVTGPDGEPQLAELELIDPVLFLTFAPSAAERLAATIGERAKARRDPA